MADTKITGLTALTTPTTDDVLAVVDDPGGSPVTKKLSILNLLTLAISNVVVQTFTSGAGATYTPTTGARKTLWIVVGGGGGAGGTGGGTTITGVDEMSGGGGGGGCVIKLAASASTTYTVGAASAAGGAGNSSTVTSPALTAGGGGVGTAVATVTSGTQAAGGTGGTASGGDLNIPGEPGMRGISYGSVDGCGGAGGDSVFGKGAAQSGSAAAGTNGGAYGGGGGGAHTADGTDRAVGAGAAGVIYVIEFLG